MPDSHNRRISVIIELSKKEFEIMAIKYTEKQLNQFVPTRVEVEEHHIGVYASKKDCHMKKEDHPKALLHGSLVSASLAAEVMNGKYVNAVPLYRLKKEFERYGLAITR